MAKTAVGLYATSAEAQQVLNDLVAAGFGRSDIRIMLGDKATRRVSEWFDDQTASATTTRSQWANGDASTTLVAAGVPSTDAQYYEEALHRGNALVSVTTTDGRINEAVSIMSRHNILAIGDLRRSWGTADTTSRAYSTTNAGYSATNAGVAGKDRTVAAGEEARIPVIEEEMRVGKREVERGGVRVSSHVTETPVEETVNLREEHVDVQRHPVDRAVSPADINNLRDQTIEVRETAEEAVIDKQARVVEEVVVRKDAETRQERVTDTVRRTDVNVEQLGSQATGGWDRYRDDFRKHYTSTYANRGHDFSYYEPGYRYGYGLLDTHPDWRGRSWNQVEADARSSWDVNQGPWEDFKDAVRRGWDRMTS